MKNNEKLQKELDKVYLSHKVFYIFYCSFQFQLNNYSKSLEEERIHLQNELQSLQQEDARSDLSETVKEQHRELVDSVHNKNRQISKLLNEIEVGRSLNIFYNQIILQSR